jgi:preprotein translocase subunit SecF
MFIIAHKKIFVGIGIALMVISIVAVAVFGLRFAVDFIGGSILEVTYPEERPAQDEISSRVSLLDLGGSSSVRPIGENGFLIRTPFLSEEQRVALIESLSFDGEREVIEERFSSVGPSIGAELRQKALIAITVVSVAIILFIAFAFRHVSEPISSWKYGLIAIFTLIHDILVPAGAFAVLGYLAGIEVDMLFVMALLAILGFSVNDTIVVFDRVRENLKINKETHTRESFDETVGKSLAQTFARSFNTSFTTLLVLLALLFFGSESTRWFALAMTLGVLAGTYSSLFLASPLLVLWNTSKENK